MHVVRLLHKWGEKNLVGVHARRQQAAWVGVGVLLRGQRLWLSALRRSIGGKVEEKHSIRRMDRLLDNERLVSERRRWYRWLAELVIAGFSHPVVVVDWSDLDE